MKPIFTPYEPAPLPPKKPVNGCHMQLHSYLAWIYVLISADHKAIKIGISGDVAKRVKGINYQRKAQGKKPAKLLYAVGMTGYKVRAAEDEIKKILADERIGDGVEWFKFSGWVLEIIKGVIRQYDPDYKSHKLPQ